MKLNELEKLKQIEIDNIFSSVENIKELLKDNLKESRYNHSLSVADTAKALAINNGIDDKKAYIAGLLHDLTKNQDDDFNLSILKEYEPKKLNYNTRAIHSYTACYFLKKINAPISEDILDAIYNHTICERRNKLNEIIFVADKRDPLRKIEDDILEISMNDIDKGYEKLVLNVEEYLVKNGEDAIRSCL